MNPLNPESVARELEGAIRDGRAPNPVCLKFGYEAFREALNNNEPFVKAMVEDMSLEGSPTEKKRRLPEIRFMIPLKTTSERIPGKNFRDYRGVPLYYWVSLSVAEARRKLGKAGYATSCWICVDSEKALHRVVCEIDRDIAKWGESPPPDVILRPAWLSEPWANGNHLLQWFSHFCEHEEPKTDVVYAQVFATAPHLKADTIVRAVRAFVEDGGNFDSLYTATEETGYLWRHGEPMNYDPDRPAGLPRSQDNPFIKETTGLYLVTRRHLLENGTRIGHDPRVLLVDREEAKDVNWPEDFPS